MGRARNKKAVLLLGGAGYIGSHLAHLLMQKGYLPIIIDNLYSGSRHAIDQLDFFKGDYGDVDLLDTLYKRFHFDAVIHLASHTQVGESVSDPLKYYQNNIAGTLTLLRFMHQMNIKNIVFSSSAAVYGESQSDKLIVEDHPKKPMSPYGRSKWMLEQILFDAQHAYQLNVICLRYFNVAGITNQFFSSAPRFTETNLIPLLLRAILKDESMTVFGMDYPTRDGTCIRDYIHVMDVCCAHWLALEKLLSNENGGESIIYNLGTGVGHSVLEVIATAEAITGRKIRTINGHRRCGDPVILVADGSRAMQNLKWHPTHSSLQQIVTDAWQFAIQKQPF